MSDANVTRERIQNRLAELRYSANFVSEKAGLDRSVLGKFLNGQVENMREQNLRAIAAVLRVDPAYLRGEVDTPSNPQQAQQTLRPINETLDVPIVGIVEAGAFRPVDWFEDVELGVVANGRNPGYPGYQYGFKVHGDSMDEAGIADGDEVVCIDPSEAGVEFGDGDWVVVERTMDGGRTRELTVKELAIHDDRYELLPRSTNKRHKPISIPRNEDIFEEGREVRIVGVVTRVVKSRPIKFSGHPGVRRGLRIAPKGGKKFAAMMASLAMVLGLGTAPCFAYEPGRGHPPCAAAHLHDEVGIQSRRHAWQAMEEAQAQVRVQMQLHHFVACTDVPHEPSRA